MKIKWFHIAGVIAVIVGLLVGYAFTSAYRITAFEAKRRLAAGDFDVVLDVRTSAERDLIGSYPGSTSGSLLVLLSVLRSFALILIWSNKPKSL